LFVEPVTNALLNIRVDKNHDFFIEGGHLTLAIFILKSSFYCNFLLGNWNSSELSFKLTLQLYITLKANQFITPAPVYKTKYLLEFQYYHLFINFIDTYGMLRSL